jgi:hypothetical protein
MSDNGRPERKERKDKDRRTGGNRSKHSQKKEEAKREGVCADQYWKRFSSSTESIAKYIKPNNKKKTDNDEKRRKETEREKERNRPRAV